MIGEIITKHQQHTTTNWKVTYPPKYMSPQQNNENEGASLHTVELHNYWFGWLDFMAYQTL